jgi:hypothetical protein
VKFPVGPASLPDADHFPRLVAVKPPPAPASSNAADFGHVSGNRLIYHIRIPIISGLSCKVQIFLFGFSGWRFM